MVAYTPEMEESAKRISRQISSSGQRAGIAEFFQFYLENDLITEAQKQAFEQVIASHLMLLNPENLDYFENRVLLPVSTVVQQFIDDWQHTVFDKAVPKQVIRLEQVLGECAADVAGLRAGFATMDLRTSQAGEANDPMQNLLDSIRRTQAQDQDKPREE